MRVADGVETQKISFNHLRDLLHQGFEELLTCLPEGEEQFLRLGREDPHGDFEPVNAAEMPRLELLHNFARATALLAAGGWPPEHIRQLLIQELGDGDPRIVTCWFPVRAVA